MIINLQRKNKTHDNNFAEEHYLDPTVVASARVTVVGDEATMADGPVVVITTRFTLY